MFPAPRHDDRHFMLSSIEIKHMNLENFANKRGTKVQNKPFPNEKNITTNLSLNMFI
jgi:hypothetical protein